MEQSTLKFLRLLIPGIIIVIISYCFIQIITDKKFGDLDFSEYSIPLFVALVFGALYQTFNIRFLITNYTHKQIDLNIKRNIMNLYVGNLSATQTQYLFKKDRLKNVFYKIIDSDPSLSAKGKNVYFNGLLWTSFADTFIISILSSIFILIFTLFNSTNTDDLRTLSFFLLLIALASICFHFVAFLNHIKISNSQIEFIETNHIMDVKNIIDKILSENNVL
ncbi:hypothetical protein C3729_05840 [Cloacibacterium normanense]|uniref:Uncharacterized protein n=1 Tax=Cloacibacterium normanense TaxID=237258 RepID=A0A2S7I4U5_9FLAO|nr:hypothetical protein [Cloacibacterium normanense]PPZ91593.1 hypothetical protein C3729_05840 [Cloacibacterium normanense]